MQKVKQFLSMLLVLSLLMSLFVLPVSAAAQDMSDMPPETHWSYAALKAALDNDLLRGAGGKLQPEALLTRGQLAAIVVRAFGATVKADLSAYTDVSASAWYYEELSKAVAMGVVSGSENRLRPEDSITRQEAFTILARAMKISGGPASALAAFPDGGKVSDWAQDAMASLVSGGYLQGNDGKLNPNDFITRAEFAQVMYKLISSYISKSGTYEKAAAGTVMVRTGGVTFKGVSFTRDLILGDGIGSGEATLDSITVAGRTVIRGGGFNSILVKGSSSLGDVVIARPDGPVALKLQDTATVKSITVYSNGAALSGIPKGTTVTVGKGVTGVTLEGTALPEGVTAAPGTTPVSGGGGTPPAASVATTSMSISPAADTVAAGEYKSFTANRNSGANDALTWASSDESVAVVDANGAVGAKKSGTATITVTAASGVLASATVYVQEPYTKNPSADEITISLPGTVLTGGSYTKITIAASVGTGDYTLNGVTVGLLVTLAGGIHSGHINGGSVGEIDMQNTPDEGSRLVLSEGASIGTLTVGSAANNVVLTVPDGTASIGSISAGAPLAVDNAAVTGSITTSADLTLTNTSTPSLTTSGSSASTVTLNDAQIGSVTAGATGGTTISGSATLSQVAASGALITGSGIGVGSISAIGNANINAGGSVGSISGAAGTIDLNNAGGTLVSASASSLSVSGTSAPVLSGTVSSVTVNANEEGSSGLTVLSGSPAISTSGSGSVGQINVGGSASPTVTASAPIGTVTVTGSAAPTVGGSASVGAVVSDSTGTTNVSNNSNIGAVLATDTSTVTGTQSIQATLTLQSIIITNYPAKLVYATASDSETPVTDGMVVTGHYAVSGFDGIVSKVLNKGNTAGEYSVGSVDMTSAGIKTVTVTASEKTAAFPITVAEKTAAMIAVTTLPTKLVYEKSEALSLNAGELTVVYSYPALYPNKQVGLSADMITGYDANTVGVQTLTVSYEGKTAVFTVAVRDSLGEARTVGVSELNAYAAQKLSSAVYSPAGQAAVKAALTSGISEINAAAKDGVAAALTNAKNAIDAVKTQDAEWTDASAAYRSAHSAALAKTAESVAISDKAAVNKALVAYAALEGGVQAKLTAEKAKLDALLVKIAALEAAQTVDAAKTAATSTLNEVFSSYATGYTKRQSDIEAAKTSGLAAISAATTVNAVTAALNSALAAMSAVKSDAALLTDYRSAKIAELNTYVAAKDKSAYDAAGKAALEQARKDGAALIGAADSENATDTALNTAKTAVDAVKTTAQLAAEKLTAAKTVAKAELESYKKSVTYRDEQKTARNNAVSAGQSAIESAANETAVAAALASAKSDIDKIKTAAQLTAEELAAAKINAKAELSAYKKKTDYSQAGWTTVLAAVTRWNSAIDSSTLAALVTESLSLAKAELDAVTTAAQEQAANNTLVDPAKNAIPETVPATTQSEVASEAAALAHVKAWVTGKLAGHPGVSFEITNPSYTAPTAGSLLAPDGTNGSYSCTIRLYAGKAPDGYGSTLAEAAVQRTLTITASPYVPTALTRAELAKGLYDAFKTGYGLSGAIPVAHQFGDISALSDEEKAAISFCFNNGFVAGKNDTTFAPNDGVTRAEAAAVLARVSPKATGFQLETTVDLTGQYTDVVPGPWYYDPVMSMGGAGVFPAETTFRPEVPITTSELSAAISVFKTKLDALNGDVSTVTDANGLNEALTTGTSKYIRLNNNAALNSEVILEAGRSLVVMSGATLTIPQSGTLEVRGALSVQAGGKIQNNGVLAIIGTLNNGGTIEGLWTHDPESENPEDGWYESLIIADVQIAANTVAVINNSGIINADLDLNHYLADTEGGDLKAIFTETDAGTHKAVRTAAIAQGAAGLKRGLAASAGVYNEVIGIGDLVFNENLTVPKDRILNFARAWSEGETTTDTTLRIENGAALTVDEGALFLIRCGGTLEGSIVNNGYMELTNKPLAITESGSITNNSHLRIPAGGSVTGGGKITNNNYLEAVSLYTADKTTVALDDCAGNGELSHIAQVSTGSKLSAAATNTTVNSILIIGEGNAFGTVTMTETVSLREGVRLIVSSFVNDATGEHSANTLVIPGGVSLTVNGETFILGILDVQSGGTLSLNGNVIIREQRDASSNFGALNNAGTVTLAENAELDCGGNITTSGTFMNNGRIIVHSGSGDDYPKYGTVTGVISGNPPENVAVVTSATELDAALSNPDVTAIRVNESTIELAAATTFTKPVTITGGGTVIAADFSLTISADTTVTDGGCLRFHASDSSAKLTIELGKTLASLYGGRIMIGDEDSDTPSAEGSVVNDGTIVCDRAELNFIAAPEWEILTGHPAQYFANRADLMRSLYWALKNYLPEQPGDNDIADYSNTYFDWEEMSGEYPDNDAISGYALLLKNGLIHGMDENKLGVYDPLTYKTMKALFSRIADKLLDEGYDNDAVDEILDEIADENDVVIYMHKEYGEVGSTYWDSSLNDLAQRFARAMGLYRVEVSSEESELTDALAKNGVSEIHITGNIELSQNITLNAVPDVWRRVIVDSGATLTVPADATLVIEQGVVLELKGKLVNNGVVDVFGGVDAQDDWEALYEEGTGAFINFYLDFAELGKWLCDALDDRSGLEAVASSDIEDSGGYGWPSGDDPREADFAFLVKYGKLERKEDGNGDFRWGAYDKVTYGELITALTNVWQEIKDEETSLPESVKLDGKTDDQFISDRELGGLLEAFVSALSLT